MIAAALLLASSAAWAGSYVSHKSMHQDLACVACHQEEVFNRATLYSFNNSSCIFKDKAIAEACHNILAAIDSREFLIL